MQPARDPVHATTQRHGANEGTEPCNKLVGFIGQQVTSEQRDTQGCRHGHSCTASRRAGENVSVSVTQDVDNMQTLKVQKVACRVALNEHVST